MQPGIGRAFVRPVSFAHAAALGTVVAATAVVPHMWQFWGDSTQIQGCQDYCTPSY
jgi:hypothetical protein